MTQRKPQRAPGRQRLSRESFHLTEEVRSIQQRAAQYDSRIVSLGPLVLFSTKTGDAWILDPADHLAAPLARDGDPLPLYIEESNTNYAIGWQGRYQIDDNAFLYEDHESRHCDGFTSKFEICLATRAVAQLST